VDKITLDTNTWRDWAWCVGKTNDVRYNNDLATKQRLTQCFKQLDQQRLAGQCRIAAPLQRFIDFQKSGYKLPSGLEEFIRETQDEDISAIASFPLAFPFSFPPEGMHDDVFALAFPHSKPGDRKYESNNKDTTLLVAHILAKQHVFLTSDNAILRASAGLKQKYNTEAQDVCSYVTSRRV
jgi:hypothetical protein